MNNMRTVIGFDGLIEFGQYLNRVLQFIMGKPCRCLRPRSFCIALVIIIFLGAMFCHADSLPIIPTLVGFVEGSGTSEKLARIGLSGEIPSVKLLGIYYEPQALAEILSGGYTKPVPFGKALLKAEYGTDSHAKSEFAALIQNAKKESNSRFDPNDPAIKRIFKNYEDAEKYFNSNISASITGMSFLGTIMESETILAQAAIMNVKWSDGSAEANTPFAISMAFMRIGRQRVDLVVAYPFHDESTVTTVNQKLVDWIEAIKNSNNGGSQEQTRPLTSDSGPSSPDTPHAPKSRSGPLTQEEIERGLIANGYDPSKYTAVRSPDGSVSVYPIVDRQPTLTQEELKNILVNSGYDPSQYRAVEQLDGSVHIFARVGAQTTQPLAPASPVSEGTGFFITVDGYLVTNAHVVGDGTRILLRTQNGLVTARIIKLDAANDLALLKAEGHFFALPVISSRSARLGSTVATVGFPNIGLQGFAPKLTKGEISSLTGIQDDPRYFQISAPVQPGNSGGALVDDRGNVVGIVSAKLDAGIALAAAGALPENVNYAIKSSFLLSFLESVPDVSAKMKEPGTKEEKFEDMVKSAEQAAILILVY